MSAEVAPPALSGGAAISQFDPFAAEVGGRASAEEGEGALGDGVVEIGGTLAEAPASPAPCSRSPFPAASPSSASSAPLVAGSETPDDAGADGDRTTGQAEQQQQQHEQQQQQQEHLRDAYARFKEMLRHPSAQVVAVQLRGFVEQFPDGLSRQEAADRIHRFLTRTQEWMLSKIVVFSADADEEGRTNTAEGLEKFLLSRLHQKIFAMDPTDRQEDDKLQERFSSLSWVSFEHLGVPPVEPALLDLAVRELRRMDGFKAPRDKLVCILNASRVINDVLKWTLEDSGACGRPLSADDFLPLLIYSVLAAKPERLHSNVEFVAAFRHPSRLNGEDAYFLTALQSTIAFIRDASPKMLEVSEEEFERRCAESAAEAAAVAAIAAAAREAETELQRTALQAAAAAVEAEDAESGSVIATVAAKAAALDQESRRLLSELVKALPLSLEAVPSVKHLRINQIATLLDEYKAMARLLREVERGHFDAPQAVGVGDGTAK